MGKILTLFTILTPISAARDAKSDFSSPPVRTFTVLVLFGPDRGIRPS